MTEQLIRRGQSTTVRSDGGKADANLSGLSYPRVTGTTRRVFLSIPLSHIAGRTIVSATLSSRVRGAWATQTLSVAAVADRWTVDKVTWNNQPAVRAGAVSSGATGALTDGARISVDVTALVQGIANGLPNYGWRIATSAGADGQFYGFLTVDSWILTVEVSDAPEQPTTLSPSGGVIGKSKFTVRTDFTDLGGSTDQASINVQVDPDMTAPYAFDSGEVVSTVPELDLNTTAYAGLANAATTAWRVRVKDTDGLWSPWSDWASVTRQTKPTLLLDSPAGGTLGDPTSNVTAHLSSGTIQFWSVQITRADDPSDVRWFSGRQPGSSASFSVAIPVKNSDNERVFRDDTTYRLRIRVWDRMDRIIGASDDPSYIESLTTFTFASNGALTAPSALSIASTPNSPYVTLTWTRAGSADGWIIHRDSDLAAVLEPGDVTALGGGQWRWVDREADPNRSQTWTVRAIVNADRSNGTSATGSNDVVGVWLLSQFGDVNIDGTAIGELKRKDKRATYHLPGRRDDVDVIGALEGISGPFAGSVGMPTHADRAAVDAAVAILKKIRYDPTTPVRMVYGNLSVPVLLRNLHVGPSPDMIIDSNYQHDVSFECWQVGDFQGR